MIDIGSHRGNLMKIKIKYKAMALIFSSMISGCSAERDIYNPKSISDFVFSYYYIYADQHGISGDQLNDYIDCIDPKVSETVNKLSPQVRDLVQRGLDQKRDHPDYSQEVDPLWGSIIDAEISGYVAPGANECLQSVGALLTFDRNQSQQ